MGDFVDPGYGDPNAPIGTHEWAKNWRLGFQKFAKDLPRAPANSKEFYDVGVKYQAWTLVTDDKGKFFREFDDFCAYRQPWGLGMDPAKFRGYLVGAIGKEATDLATASRDGRAHNGANQYTLQVLDSDHGDPNPKPATAKPKRLRAILRAPELVQDLYRESLISQKAAIKLGPVSPTPDRAAAIAEARQKLEQEPRPADAKGKPAFRKKADAIVRAALGVAAPSPLARIRKLIPELSHEDLAVLIAELTERAAPPWNPEDPQGG